MTDRLQAADLNERLWNCKLDLANLLDGTGDEQLRALGARLSREWQEHEGQDILNIAFVGQYSAGKSTMISALTGRDDIEIDADIATSEARAYRWNGLSLVDTPGLYTERTDHDELTEAAIRKADLLVYCLTYMLFDTVTAENFKDLAFRRGFARKMLLAVNKMNSEPGDRDTLVANYRASLEATLAPNALAPFRPTFLDALDYLDAREDEDEALEAESGFAAFVAALNEFAEKRGVLGRLDAPARIIRAAAQDAEVALGTVDGEGDAYLLLLQKLSRVVRNERERLRGKVAASNAALSDKIIDRGHRLLPELEKTKDQEALFKRVESELEAMMRSSSEGLQPLIKESAERLQTEIDGVLESELATQFVASVERTELDRSATGADAASLQGWKTIKTLGSEGSKQLVKMAGGELGGGLLAAGGAAGSQLHQLIYEGGKLIGYNFRPWEAVNLAKTVGNVAQVAGVLLSVVGLALEAVEFKREREREETEGRARLEVVDQFHSVADAAVRQFDRFLRDDVEPALFGHVEGLIDKARDDYRAASEARDVRLLQVRAIESRVDEVLATIGSMSAATARA